jgi:hypothetical protein
MTTKSPEQMKARVAQTADLPTPEFRGVQHSAWRSRKGDGAARLPGDGTGGLPGSHHDGPG